MEQEIKYQNKVFGYIRNDCYITSRTRDHLFRIFGNGFGVSEAIIGMLKTHGVHTIVIKYEGTNVFLLSIYEFEKHAWNYTDTSENIIDKGDKQLVCPLEFWKTEGDIEHG